MTALAQGTEARPTTRTAVRKPVQFAVASVRPTDPHSVGWKIEFTVDGFTARGATLSMLIKEAYAMYEAGRVVGEASWMGEAKFDIEAKLDADEVPQFAELSLDERRGMLRELLGDRFKLRVRREAREMPVCALTVAKGGPKMRETNPEGAFHPDIKGVDELITRGGRGVLEGTNFTMPGLAVSLAFSARCMIVDRTGLKGRYDIALHWAPEGVGVAPDSSATEALGPSLFTAVQEQLGLKLVATKAPVEVIVVDSASKPSEN